MTSDDYLEFITLWMIIKAMKRDKIMWVKREQDQDIALRHSNNQGDGGRGTAQEAKLCSWW